MIDILTSLVEVIIRVTRWLEIQTNVRSDALMCILIGNWESNVIGAY